MKKLKRVKMIFSSASRMEKSQNIFFSYSSIIVILDNVQLKYPDMGPL